MLRFGLILFLFLQVSLFNKDYDDVSKNEISIITKSFNKSYHTYQLNVTYPELRDRMNLKHEELNLKVQGVMFSAITEFQEQVEMRSNKNSFSYLNFDYTVCSNFNEAMSLRFVNRVYHPGMNNAQELYKTLNYDKLSGQIIKLADLFDPEIDYNQELVNIINNKFSNCSISNTTALKSFCLSADYLTIILDKNKLQDNFCANEIKISWPEIRLLLNPESIAYRLSNK
jgi:hypothetical protein